MRISGQPHRKSLRLRDYDYSQPGDYFITLVTHERDHLFGNIIEFEMQLNPVGQIVREEWIKTPAIRPEIELGEFIIMPNHFHAIVHITDLPVGAYGHTPLQQNGGTPLQQNGGTPLQQNGHTPLHQNGNPSLHNPTLRSPSKTLGALVRGFKGSVTTRINHFRASPGFPVWQRNYYEHIINSDNEYALIAAYIENNPSMWLNDEEYRG